MSKIFTDSITRPCAEWERQKETLLTRIKILESRLRDRDHEISYLKDKLPLEEKISIMLKEWEQAGYEGDEEQDRAYFATRLISLIQQELQE